jgi:hypothetical protein
MAVSAIARIVWLIRRSTDKHAQYVFDAANGLTCVVYFRRVDRQYVYNYMGPSLLAAVVQHGAPVFRVGTFHPYKFVGT